MSFEIPKVPAVESIVIHSLPKNRVVAGKAVRYGRHMLIKTADGKLYHSASNTIFFNAHYGSDYQLLCALKKLGCITKEHAATYEAAIAAEARRQELSNLAWHLKEAKQQGVRLTKVQQKLVDTFYPSKPTKG